LVALQLLDERVEQTVAVAGVIERFDDDVRVAALLTQEAADLMHIDK